jgi:D-alanyl-lipoteichoic acid acyltransferase DltB (MBOAT superfamily)
MLFNSYSFLFFLPVVFLLYWRIRNVRHQNLFLILASYVFYGWWDWRFLSLIVFSSGVDYVVGRWMSSSEDSRTRRKLLFCSLLTNLGLLGFFKYFDFFIESAAMSLEMLGFQAHPTTLRIILPVGISFYTFQTLSYTIDIYQRKLEPTKDPVAFFAFVSFFPQLVAGPIERAKQLLPQFLQTRRFETGLAVDGLRQMLWGFFKKVVIADQCAIIVDYCFNNGADLNWFSHVVGVIFFAFQIYGDFSGYSDIAIGLARLFGFKLMRNFAYPYFSRDIAEFWRRWHISLSTWFRDYLYIPLGGSFTTKWRRIRNILITFTVSGLWHGASWNFVFWGFLNGCYYIPLMLARKHKSYRSIVARGKWLPTAGEILRILGTFVLTCIAWIFFRAVDMPNAIAYLGATLGQHTGDKTVLGYELLTSAVCVAGISTMLLVEWLQREKEHGLATLPFTAPVRWAIYIVLGFVVMNYFGSQQAFIYFQF